MSDIDTKLRRETETESSAAAHPAEPPPVLPSTARRRRFRIFPLLITLAVVAVAVVFGRAMWDAYMGAPWTRDGTVRAYVVTMAPQVAGQIVQLPVADNQFVHKGDLLMVIDPTDYKIAVSLNEAAVQQAQVNAQNAETEAKRRLDKLLADPFLVRSEDGLRWYRAVLLLERLGTPEGKAVLQSLASGDPAARETRAARRALGP